MQAVKWAADGTPTALNLPGITSGIAEAINDRGQIVGNSSERQGTEEKPARQTAFLRQQQGSMTFVAAASGVVGNTFAAINKFGYAAGCNFHEGDNVQATLYGPPR